MCAGTIVYIKLLSSSSVFTVIFNDIMSKLAKDGSLTDLFSNLILGENIVGVKRIMGSLL